MMLVAMGGGGWRDKWMVMEQDKRSKAFRLLYGVLIGVFCSVGSSYSTLVGSEE